MSGYQPYGETQNTPGGEGADAVNTSSSCALDAEGCPPLVGMSPFAMTALTNYWTLEALMYW